MKNILYQLYDKSCFRFICEKFIPQNEFKNSKKPSTLLIWLIGIHISIYGISETRYQVYIGRVENNINLVNTFITTANYTKGLELIPDVQNIKVPYPPELSLNDIFSPYKSLLYDESNEYHPEQTERLKKFVEIFKDSLKNIDLSKINLINANLSKSNINNVNFFMSDLSYVSLVEANCSSSKFIGCVMLYAKLYNCNFDSTDLSGSDLRFSDFSSVSFKGTNLEGVRFDNSNLTNAKNLTPEQLLNALSLYEAKLDHSLLTKIKKLKPDLLEKKDIKIIWEDEKGYR